MFISLIIAISTSFFLKNKQYKKEVFFLGHKLDENILQIINLLKDKHEFNYQYCTIVFNDYKLHKASNINCLYLLFPRTWIRLLNSKLIISLHGIYFQKLFLSFSKAKTVYLAHAFRTGFSEETNKKLYKFDEVWLSTNFEKDIYLRKAKYTSKNLYVLGYPKYDSVDNYLENSIGTKNNILKEHNVQKIVTLGPTRNLKNKILQTNELSILNVNFLKKIDYIAKKLSILFIISPHPTADDLSSDVKTFINSSTNIFTSKYFQFKNTFESLAVSDCLISDISTLCIDNLFFENDLIIVKSKINKKVNFSNVLDDFNDFKCNNFKELESQLISSKENKFKKEIEEKFVGFQRDSNNSKRCFERIKFLIEN